MMSTPQLPTDAPVVAVDIGGTKIAVAMLTASGRILLQDRIPTPQAGPDQDMKCIMALIERVIANSGVEHNTILGIGIGIPAVLEKETDLILWAPNLKDWRNVPLRDTLERHFQMPVSVEYDGHTAVLGEWWLGAGKGYGSLVSVIIGTGVGGGMVLEGRLIKGFNRLAGAVGWFKLDSDGDSESVHARELGSWEAHIAGPGLVAGAAALLAKQKNTPSLLRESNDCLTPALIYQAARQKDSLALQIVHEEAESIGRGLAAIVSLVNPEVIILGGSIGANSGFLLPVIQETVMKYAQPVSGQSVHIVISDLGTAAGLFGAAYGLLLRLQYKKPTT